MTDRIVKFIFASIMATTGGYLFVFGANALAGVVDVYLDYSLTIIFVPISLYPIPFTIPLLTAILIGSLLIIGAFYLLLQTWEEFKILELLKKYFLNNGQRKKGDKKYFQSNDVLKDSDEEPEESEDLKNSKKQLDDLEESKSNQLENVLNIIIGTLFLIFGIYLIINASVIYFTHAPQDLGSFITWRPLNFELPIIIVIAIGILLWIASWLTVKEAVKELKYLEETQLAYQLRKNSSQQIQNITLASTLAPLTNFFIVLFFISVVDIISREQWSLLIIWPPALYVGGIIGGILGGLLAYWEIRIVLSKDSSLKPVTLFSSDIFYLGLLIILTYVLEILSESVILQGLLFILEIAFFTVIGRYINRVIVSISEMSENTNITDADS